MLNINDFMSRAIDTHTHCNPDTSIYCGRTITTEGRIDECHNAGMYGTVIKTHSWPQSAYLRKLNERYEDFQVYPAVALNTMVGGVRPWVVEMAYQQGFKMVYFPTMTARTERDGNGYIKLVAAPFNPYLNDLRDDEWQYILNDDGSLKQDAKDCLKLCKEHNLVVGTGHMTKPEIFELVKYAKEIGFDKLTITHAMTQPVSLTKDEVAWCAEMGAKIELLILSVISILPAFQEFTILDYLEVINRVGAENCMLGTDEYFDWQPSQPEQFKMAIQGLQLCGLSDEDAMKLIETPHKLFED